jgi:hypothetical protein
MRAKERAQHRAAAVVASSPSATELMDLQPLSQPVLVSAAAPRYICRIVIASLLCAATIAMNVYLFSRAHVVVNLVGISVMTPARTVGIGSSPNAPASSTNKDENVGFRASMHLIAQGTNKIQTNKDCDSLSTSPTILPTTVQPLQSPIASSLNASDDTVQIYMDTLWSLQGKPLIRVKPTDKASGAGRFHPTADCPTPKLWIFLSGGYRTFRFSKFALKTWAEATAKGCWFMAMATANEVVPNKNITESTRSTKFISQGDLGMILGGKTFAERVLADQDELDGRLAYILYDCLDPGYNTYGSKLYSVGWHGAWLAARWAAEVNSFPIDPLAVVVRARPDVVPSSYLAYQPLRHYFESVPDSWRLEVGSLFASDLLMLTSFRAFEELVAMKYERAQRAKQAGNDHVFNHEFAVAQLNGWQYGSLTADETGQAIDMRAYGDYGAKNFQASEMMRMYRTDFSHTVHLPLSLFDMILSAIVLAASVHTLSHLA